jgi:hypothetical protein
MLIHKISRDDHGPDTLFSEINKVRLSARKGWWVVTGPFYGHWLEIKAFGSWAQIFRVDGVDYTFGHTDTVSAWKQNTLRVLQSLVP